MISVFITEDREHQPTEDNKLNFAPVTNVEKHNRNKGDPPKTQVNENRNSPEENLQLLRNQSQCLKTSPIFEQLPRNEKSKKTSINKISRAGWSAWKSAIEIF